MSDFRSIQTDLNDVQLEVELQLETPEAVSTSTSKIIDTYGTYSKVEPIEPMVAVIAIIDKVHIRCPKRYGCNNSFDLFAVKEIASENPCRAFKGACGVGDLMRSSILTKFKHGLDLENIYGDWAHWGLWESSSRVQIFTKRL